MCALFLSLEVAAVCYLKKNNNNNNFSSKFFPPNRVIVPGKIRARSQLKRRLSIYIFLGKVKAVLLTLN